MGQADLPAEHAARKLLGDIRSMIESARGQLAQTVNAGLAMLYWSIGRRIRQDILGGQRARYGERVVSTVGEKLAAEYGQGFSEKSLRRMIQFAAVFPDQRIVASLMRQLRWAHFLSLIGGAA
jgi:hypothetical protein